VSVTFQGCDDCFHVRTEPLLGNAGECSVWSACRLAHVCHCAGWLADSEQEVACAAPGGLPPDITYGNHVMGLRVINNKGRRLHPIGAFGRAAFCVILPIGLLGAGQWPEPLPHNSSGNGGP
jgi:hypothetical protein